VTAVMRPVAATTALVEHSEGVWHAAWRRFRMDKVGLASALIVILFIVLIAAAGLGWVAGQWQKEVAVANAPPDFLGPRPAEAMGEIEVPKGPNVDLSAIDPLAPRYKEWE
jgi:oligopeptide transport system permease protein